MTYFFKYATLPIKKIEKRLHPPLPQKSDLGITKNYCGIAFTSKDYRDCNALLLARIEPEIEKTLRKNGMDLIEIDPKTHRFLYPSNL